ncbi:hydroxyacid dehydrogenase [Alloalcanivorax marinus]|uniref:hydroxyacid dehydrogenase n=1 Tax=Alloalcanivorax marinus TaxID=1177169 RepID=UPI0019342EA8|nr:hydroxyacid dehydrogenase [Alloalcanivorax marinus]MBL7250114.1 hydroxyacid dehydrogenase [Alloalcanivorax marinus]
MPVCLIAEPIHPVATEKLEQGGVTVRAASSPRLETIANELTDVDAIIVRDALPAAAMDLAPRLAIIANHGTGTNAVDVAHAHRLGIPVAYTPTSNVRSVAEHTIMLMLAALRRVVPADEATRAADTRFRYDQPIHSVYEKTLAVIGFGHVGKLVIAMAREFGMRVRVFSPSADPDEVRAYGVEYHSTLASALDGVDVVTLHRPLRDDTRHTLNRENLALLPPSAVVINTSRGGLIDEQALAQALRDKRLFAAGLDVLDQEPMAPDSPLAGLDNVVFTPHMAGSSQEALLKTALQCADHVLNALSGRRPSALVDPDVWQRRRFPYVSTF